MTPCNLHANPLNFVESNVVATPAVELGRAGRCVIGHRRRVFERTAVFQVGGDSGRAKRVVANLGVDAGLERSASHHRIRIGLGQGGGAQESGAALNRAEEWPFRIASNPGATQVLVQIRVKRVVTGHFVLLSAFLAQPHPQPLVLHVHVLDPHY